MAVHPDGLGSGWTQDVDADQPHGLDYRYINHVAIALRSRIKQEHSDFADATVGGIHKPGGCAVLGMEDDTADILADGTYRARGLVWDLTQNLWCATETAGASTTGDWTLVKLHPDKQWAGGDITWQGGHEFDATIDVTGNVAIDGDVSVDGTVNAGTIVCVGDFSIDGTMIVKGVDFESTAIASGAVKFFGKQTKVDTDGNALAAAHCYSVNTDGIVTAKFTPNAATNYIAGYVADGTGVGAYDATAEVAVVGFDTANTWWGTITFPVGNGQCFEVRVVDGVLSYICWTPIGDGSCGDKD